MGAWHRGEDHGIIIFGPSHFPSLTWWPGDHSDLDSNIRCTYTICSHTGVQTSECLVDGLHDEGVVSCHLHLTPPIHCSAISLPHDGRDWVPARPTIKSDVISLVRL